MPKVVVIGAGNPLMGDDGVAQEVLQRLKERIPEWVELVDAGTNSLDALIDAKDAECVILVDAIDAGEPAGTLFRLDSDTIRKCGIPSRRISLHQMTFAECLALAELTGFDPEKLIVLGIQPAVVEPRMRLSETVAEKLPQLVAMIEDEIRRVCDDKDREEAKRASD